MTLTTLLLLLPHSGFTHVWHIASEQFNSADDYSPVWEAYRVIRQFTGFIVCTLNLSKCSRARSMSIRQQGLHALELTATWV